MTGLSFLKKWKNNLTARMSNTLRNCLTIMKNAVEPIGKVLKYDNNALVRHEAAFSLGQLGYRTGIPALAHAVSSDSSFFVRHEAAVALGVIGSEEARETLSEALKDESEEVRESAVVALANLDYIKATNRAKSLFSKMTGG
ncbi:MAG: putative repeat-containing lyase [Nitrososphaera sp.]|nr:putative repeat-containing lyase [Nitrososphaera sp.]